MQLRAKGITKWWQKLLGSTATVVLDSTLISIQTKREAFRLPLNNIEKFDIKKGWLSTKLVIHCEGNPPVVLKGYTNKQLNDFKAQFIQSLLTLVAASQRWKEFELSLEHLKNRDVYLSSYEWQPIAELHKLATKFNKLGVEPSHVKDKAYQKTLQQAQRLTDESVGELGRELHNQSVVPILLSKYADFFETVEKSPLTEKQRIACVTNDDHNLVIAGAGTGKTATLVGKAGFLVESGVADAKNVLMLAFGNKAAAEMNERIKERIPSVAHDIKASTFHALGNEIVAKFGGYKKAVTPFAEQPHQFTQFINNTIDELAEQDESYKALIVNYFSSLGAPGKTDLDFKTIEEYYDFLSSCRLITLKSEWVKSVGELRVANYLTLNGIAYEYEADYKYDTKSVARRQYQPDFYLPEADIYIEYLGLNEKFETAPFVDQESYLESLEWKRELHRSKGTVMAELYSYQLSNGTLPLAIKQVLDENFVETKTISLTEIFKQLKAENETQWLGFIELIQRFLGLYKEGGHTVEDLQASITAQEYDVERANAFLALFAPILSRYQAHLQETDTVDFSDMISLAVEIIEDGKFFNTYSHILVDEFQDISGGRANLLNALLASKPNMRLFAVGDDWQSIYRFNGADITLFTEFNQTFSPSTAVPLDKTFRFNNKIHNVSSKFVMANPGQLKKEITTNANIDVPALRLVDIKQENKPTHLSIKEQKKHAYQNALKRSLNTFNKSAQNKNERLSVLIIGRYRKENMQMLVGLNVERLRYAFLDINYVTAHASKGLEADYVVVLGVETGSFPSSRENDELIDLVLPQKENYLHAEERRLFYVALTRAKHFVYVLFDSDQGSPFLVEINKYGNKLVDNKLASSFTKWHCPSCMSGSLKALQTRYNKTFYKCTHAPACDVIMSACKHCQSPMQTNSKGFRFCLGCAEVELGCLRCGTGTMVARLEDDPNRETFYGCNRFRRGADDSCGENIRVQAYESRYTQAKEYIAKGVGA